MLALTICQRFAELPSGGVSPHRALRTRVLVKDTDVALVVSGGKSCARS
jgi:hypothetical protein